MRIEPLEPRIAPAAVLKFTDLDGDAVTIKTSKGTNELLQEVCLFTPESPGSARLHLDLVNFLASAETAVAFKGTDLTISVSKRAGGDGFVDVGRIDARTDGDPLSMDLGKVTVRGTLETFEVGDNDVTTLALRSLNVREIASSGGASVIEGPTGKINVKGDFLGRLHVTGANETGTVKSLRIGGNIEGTAGIVGSGTIRADGIETTLIGGSVIAASAVASGQLVTGKMNQLTIRGSVIGGAAEESGYVETEGGRKILIGGDIVGGFDDVSGLVSFVDCASVTVNGNIEGGTAFVTGALSGTAGEVTPVIKIGGSIIAGTGFSSGSLAVTGTIQRLTIRGDIDGNGTDPDRMSGIAAATQIDKLILLGKLIDSGRIITFQTVNM